MHVDPERNSEYNSKLTSVPYFHQRLIWRILPYSLTSRLSYFLTLTQPDSQPNARRLALSCRPRTGPGSLHKMDSGCLADEPLSQG